MNLSPFVHLKLHTAYSLCEGAVKIPDLITACISNKFPAVAITDTNNMFGVLEFSMKLSEHGIQPIIGTTLDLLAYDTIASIVLLAKTELGYKNLMKLMTCYYFHNKSETNKRFITLQNLYEVSKDIICFSGGALGPSGQLFISGDKQNSFKLLEELFNIFNDDFYIEISRTGEQIEQITEEFFINYSLEKNIPLVATNEVFFLEKSMHIAHDALLCIANSTYLSVNKRRKVSEEHYLKSSNEMYDLFADLKEAVLNTSLIAQRCAFMPEKKKPILPQFTDNTGENEDKILDNQARIGLIKKLEIVKNYKTSSNFEELKKQYQDRFEYELKVIKSMGFSGYFLIVSDFVKWSKEHDIPVGPGRGSGAGSIIAWCLHITELDPIKYNLLFERFLNPERISMPDFDIDFCQYRRDETIDYVQQKYGKNKVAHIIALGKLQARNVIRDVGRVLQMPYGQVDKITKLVPQNPTNPIDLKQALELEPQLKEMMDSDQTIKFLIETAMQLEGLYRHASMHAAGIVIGNENIDDLVPLYSDGESPLAITQFNMKYVEIAGLVKFDFLGLKTLTVIQHTVKNIKKYKNINIDISNINMEDPTTFKLLCNVDVTGVFQLESPGMKEVIRNLQPDNIEDIIALISLYRPGPMDNIPVYLARKHGKEKIEYLHPILEPILKNTYGVMIYQEQVMQIAQKMGGYTLAGADLLRRAMGKKIKEEMEKNRSIFEEGAKKQGINSKVAVQVFDMMEKFASYGFNRSHAAAYGVISYQTAYLKANFRIEFYIASLNIDIDKTDKIAVFIADAKQYDINILPPDINISEELFIEEDKNSIRYALGALKGSSLTVMQNIVNERKKNGLFKDVFDFFKRITLAEHGLTSRQAEILILSGALDSIISNSISNRRQIFKSIRSLMNQDREATTLQRSLFNNYENNEIKLADVSDWNFIEKLELERQVVTFYLRNHPLEFYSDILKHFKVISSKDFIQTRDNIYIAGILMNKKDRLSKNGQKFAFITLSDANSSYDVSLMPEIYSKVREILFLGRAYLLKVQLKVEGDNKRIFVQEMHNLEDILKNQSIYIKIGSNTDLERLKKYLDNIKDGNNKIYLLTTNKYGQTLEINTGYSKLFDIEIRNNLIRDLDVEISY